MPQINIKNLNIEFRAKPVKCEDGKYFFLTDNKLDIFQQAGDTKINKFKNLLKKYSMAYEIIRNCLYPILIINGKNINDLLAMDRREKEIIVNLASGNNTRSSFINVDLFPLSKVDIVASIDDLPFADNSIDKIIMEASLEHIADPEKTIKEIYRVLKKGGLAFITVPFMVGYHDSPSDYWRWTKEGFRLLLKDFKIIEIGNKGGIASALGWVLAEFIATFFSFGSKKIHFAMFHLALIVLIPLKLLDFIFVYFPTTSNISSMFYAIAKKE